MKLVPGKFPAKIKSHGVGKAQNKAIRAPVYVEFEVTDPTTGEIGTIYWWGNMDDKKNPESKFHPYEISIKNLVTMGLKGTDPYSIAENAAGTLNVFKEYELELENNTFNGKTSIRVKYVNIPGAGGVKETLTAAEARQMAGFNFASVVLAARQQSGIKEEPASSQADEDTDIPF